MGAGGSYPSGPPEANAICLSWFIVAFVSHGLRSFPNTGFRVVTETRIYLFISKLCSI